MHSSNIQKKYVFARDWVWGGGIWEITTARKKLVNLFYDALAVKIYVLIYPLKLNVHESVKPYEQRCIRLKSCCIIKIYDISRSTVRI